MEETYYPLFSEILDRVHKAKTKDKKIDILRQYKTDALKMFLKAGFDPLFPISYSICRWNAYSKRRAILISIIRS